MEDLRTLILLEMMRRRMPDMSHIQPPTTSAAEKMIANLRGAAGTKADKSPEHIEYLRKILAGLFD